MNPLPCPFCGQQPDTDDGETGGTVECMNRECGVHPSLFVDHEDNVHGLTAAITAWNERGDAATQRVLREDAEHNAARAERAEASLAEATRLIGNQDHAWKELTAINERVRDRAKAAEARTTELEWIDVRIGLPPEDVVVEVAAISGYDGSLFRAFMARHDDGDGWLWSRCRGWDLTEADEEDDHCVAFWRRPTPLPEARFPDFKHDGRPTPYAEVNDPTKPNPPVVAP